MPRPMNSRAKAAMNAAERGHRMEDTKKFVKDLPSRLKAEAKSLVGMKPTRSEFLKYREVRTPAIRKYGRDPRDIVSDPDSGPKFRGEENLPPRKYRGEANDPRYRRDLKK